jgi:hypothetical protein
MSRKRHFIKTTVRVCAVLLFILVSSALGAENFLHHSIRATILVADPERTADLLASWAEKVGGYYLVKSTHQVLFRFPYRQTGRLRQFLEEVADEMVELSPSAVDLREDVLGIQSGIRSREEILQRNLSFIDEADVEGTLAIEAEIVQLLAEIEELKGRLRKLTVDMAYAKGEVQMRFMQQSIPEDIPSSFDWINTVDFYQFIREGLR